MSGKTVAVIDGNSLMHRAFHAVPPTMTAPDGTPTNACFGFLAMLLKFVEIAEPDAIVCAFDAGRPAFRMADLEQYKAQRPPMDPGLKAQFPIIEELLTSMNIPVVRVQGWEGDDVLGTVAARDEELGYHTLLVSGDKDVYQLCTENTNVVTTKKGITDVAIYGPAQVIERYGVTPAQFTDYLGLKGDSADNIPGVPGIGDKTAAKLLQAYGSLEGIYEHVDELRGKQKENIENNKEAAFVSREVATIVRDLEFDLDLEAASFPSFDAAQTTEVFRKYRMNSHLARVLRLAGAEPVRQNVKLVCEPVFLGDDATGALDKAIKDKQRIGVVFAEPEQTSLFDEGVSLALGMPTGVALLKGDDAQAAFARIVKEASFAALDVKAALKFVYPSDSSQAALVSEDDLLNMQAFDLGLAAYVLDSSSSQYTFDALLDTYMGGVLPSAKTDDERALAQAAAALALVEPLKAALVKDGSTKAYADIDLPLVAVLAVMERTGCAIDVAKLEKLGETTGAELDALRAQIYELAGEEFNVDSPKQLGHILFEVLGLPAKKKTQRGYSTDAKVLKDLASVHDLPKLVLRYRELAKIKSTYIDALPRMRANDGLVHSSFNETVTTTGRLSSSDPNLQNIPVRTDFGRQIRECFVPLAQGEKFLSADYSQIELRLLAHLSGDAGLIDAFCSGADFHAATAARVFGVPLDEVTPQLRSRAKAVNFGIVYGQQAFGLSQSLGISIPEAKDIIDAYFEAHPGVRTYLDQTVEVAKKCGYAQTMFGRKRHIPELTAGNGMQRAFGERTAMNHPMQGSAADIIKLAMRQVQERLREGGFKAKLLVQVHDELDFSVPVDEVERLSAMVKDAMENVAQLKVPLVADVGVGDTWAESH